MQSAFWLAAIVALVSTAAAITRKNAIHSLLYLVVSLLATALIFFLLGAPLAAALEVIVYAGAILIFFVFVVMMLDLGRSTDAGILRLGRPGSWLGPAVLFLLLGAEFLWLIGSGRAEYNLPLTGGVSPKEVGMALFGPWLIGVELASMLLLAGLLGAYHLGRSFTGRGEGEREREGGGK